VFEALGGNRRHVLEAVKKIRDGIGTTPEYHPGTTEPGASELSGTHGPPLRGPGTTSDEPPLQLVPDARYRQESPTTREIA